MPESKQFKILLKRSFYIISMALVISLFYNYLNPGGIPIINNYSTINIAQDQIKVPVFLSRNMGKKQKLNIHPPQEIGLNEVHKSFFQGNTVFIDARDKDIYKKGHIPGAISIPLMSVNMEHLDLTNLNPQQKIIVYCDDANCSISIELAAILENMGFMNIYIFTGGWGEWEKAGYQISRIK